VGSSDFQIQLGFISDFINELGSFYPSRISVVTYSTDVENVIYLNDHNMTDPLVAEIEALS